jgi:hypothetical protein
MGRGVGLNYARPAGREAGAERSMAAVPPLGSGRPRVMLLRQGGEGDRFRATPDGEGPPFI